MGTNMNQKVLVALAVIALILGILNLIIILLPPQANPINIAQKIPLRVTNTCILQMSEDYYSFEVTVSLPDEVQTLFGCYIQADYLTENGSWKTTLKEFGIVNYHESVTPQFHVDLDFAYEGYPLKSNMGRMSYNGANLKVEAYGYLKP
jgi:hypothetical protein